MFWTCFSKASATVEPVIEPAIELVEEKKDESNVFPILKLPEKLKIRILEGFSPFDLLAFSLCTEVTKALAKQTRCLPKFKKDSKPFKMVVGVMYQRMVMEFEEYPSVYFQLLRNRELVEKYRSEVKLKDVMIGDWDIREQERSLFADSKTLFDGIPCSFNTLNIVSDNSVPELHKFFTHLCDVFNPPDSVLSIDLDCSFMQSLLHYHEETGESWPYLIIQASEATSETYIRSVFDRVRVQKGLFLRCRAHPNFVYDLGRFNMEESLEIHFSCWVKLEQIFNVKCEKVALFLSRLCTDDLKVLIEKWRGGWTPEWKQLLIEMKDVHVLDDIVEGQSVLITDAKDRRMVDKKSPIQLYKFDEKWRIRETSFYIYGFHMVRDDGEIATVFLTKRNVAIFIIQPENTKNEFLFEFNRRLFLPRRVWS